jgi:uncharacterized protein (TIGR00730 family)
VLRSLCVFCGSSFGRNPLYREAAETVGRLVARRGLQLVYGGGTVGLMGALADAALAAGGRVVGVIPEALVLREVGHERLSERHVVRSMHERKGLMAELADGFLALPGGFGTFEELFEIVTWAQLGLHRKPVGLLNVAGYYDGLLALVEHAARERFVRDAHRDALLSDDDPARLLDRLASQRPPAVEKWIRPEEA